MRSRVAGRRSGAAGHAASTASVSCSTSAVRTWSRPRCGWLAGVVRPRRASWRRWCCSLAGCSGALLPASARAPCGVRLIVLGSRDRCVAVPVLGRFGARPDNPTLLDRDYLGGVARARGASRARRGAGRRAGASGKPADDEERVMATGPRRRRRPDGARGGRLLPARRMATRSIEAADGETALRVDAGRAGGSGGARPDAAGHRRARGLSTAARHQRRPGDHADRPRRRGRPGGGAGARRRRLRHQAVQPARARAAGRLGPAPLRRAATRTGRPFVDGDLVVDTGEPPGDA